MIAELLRHMFDSVESECGLRDEPDCAEGPARRAAWTSYRALCYWPGSDNPVDRLGLDVSDPEVHLSPELTSDEWESMLVTGGVFDALLWDTDWRIEAILERSENASREVRELMGFDLKTVHRLVQNPTRQQLETAESYLRGLSARA